MKILFSPVGMTDPVSVEKNENKIVAVHEGALLQILRYERPDKVLLYYSGETVQHEKEDQRYIGGIRLLEQDLGITFDVETIEHPELKDVHLFDGFLVEFREILEKLREQNPDAEILVNTSSGTPAMKSTLQILAAASTLCLKPVQVATWTESSNHARPCDIQTEWEINADRRPDSRSRVTVSGHTNLLYEFNRKVLIQLIDEYDYHAASLLCRQIGPMIPRKFTNLLGAAILRSNAKFTEAQHIFRECMREDLMPEVNVIGEYFLLLSIKAQKQENADLLRMISPIFIELLARAIRKQFDINIDDFRNDFGTWNKSALQNSVLSGKFNQVLAYHRGERIHRTIPDIPRESFIASWHLTNLIENLSDPNRDLLFVQETNQIRSIEEKTRNVVAHTMTGFTDSELRRNTGFSAQELVDKIKRYIRQYTDIPLTDEFLQSYQNLNDKLKSYL